MGTVESLSFFIEYVNALIVFMEATWYVQSRREECNSTWSGSVVQGGRDSSSKEMS